MAGQLGDLMGFAPGGVQIDMLTIFIIVGVVLVLLLLGIVGLLVWWFKSFNIQAVIEEKLEHGTYVTTKRARIRYDKRDQGNPIERIQLLGQKNSWFIMPPSYVAQELKSRLMQKIAAKKKRRDGGYGWIPLLPEADDPVNIEEEIKKQTNGWYKSLYGVTKGGKKAIRLLKEGNEYTCIPWSDEKTIEYLQESRPVRKQWANNSFREGLEVFKDEPSFMQKYGGMITMMGAMLTIAIIFIFLFAKFDTLEAVAGAMNRHSEAMIEMAKTARAVGVQNVGG